MKKIIILSTISLLIFAAVLVACNKDVEGRTDNTPALHPANIDINAGTWKPILLASASEFAVAAPVATTTPDYIAQVNEIKTWQADLTSDENRLGSVACWILRVNWRARPLP